MDHNLRADQIGPELDQPLAAGGGIRIDCAREGVVHFAAFQSCRNYTPVLSQAHFNRVMVRPNEDRLRPARVTFRAAKAMPFIAAFTYRQCLGVLGHCRRLALDTVAGGGSKRLKAPRGCHGPDPDPSYPANSEVSAQLKSGVQIRDLHLGFRFCVVFMLNCDGP